MANPDFHEVILHDVEFVYPRLNGTYKFDHTQSKTVQCKPTAQGAAWSVGIKLPKKQADELIDDLTKHYLSCRDRNDGLPEFSGVFGAKSTDDGAVIFTAKKSGADSEGEVKKAPMVLGVNEDGKKYQMSGDQLGFWSGSRGHVKMSAYPSKNPQDASGGISLGLNAVIVTEAKRGGDNEFTPDAAPPADEFSEPPF